ncbi:hypothetical protein FB446DRAFT_709615 [Lentinula raphanica]|nr:hypothetical protein FB446DRAFT_709615 [Lentinula raphanica]
MPLHAYYCDGWQPGDPIPESHRYSRPASRKDLASLGIDVIPLEGPDYQSSAQEVAKERGYPVTVDSSLHWHFKEPHKNTPTASGIILFILTFKVFTITFEKPFCMYIEDPLKHIWIHAEYTEDTGLDIPAGVLRHANFSAATRTMTFIEGVEEDFEFIWDEEAETHPIRQDYLKSIGLGKQRNHLARIKRVSFEYEDFSETSPGIIGRMCFKPRSKTSRDRYTECNKDKCKQWVNREKQKKSVQQVTPTTGMTVHVRTEKKQDADDG